MLHDLAAMVVSTMVARRHRLIKEEYETRFQSLAQTFSDTNQNLQRASNSIEKVLDCHSWDMDSDDAYELSGAVRNLAIQSQICAATTRIILQSDMARNTETVSQKQVLETQSNEPQAKALIAEGEGILEVKQGSLFDNYLRDYDKIFHPTTDMQNLFDNIHAVCSGFPRSNTVTLELFQSVPKFLVAEDLLLFRSVLNVITHCMGAGNNYPSGLRIGKRGGGGVGSILDGMEQDRDGELLIQCFHGGPLVKHATAKALFRNKDSLLAPVATMVRSMGGQYGTFVGTWEANKNKSHESREEQDEEMKLQTMTMPQCNIYWFHIPYQLPEGVTEAADDRFQQTQVKVLHPGSSSSRNDPSPNSTGEQAATAVTPGGVGTDHIHTLQVVHTKARPVMTASN